MLVEYKGRRFNVSDRTYAHFSSYYPDRASKLKIIKEAEDCTYYNFDKLKELIEPDNKEIKEYLKKKHAYYTDKYDETLEMEINNEYVPPSMLHELHARIQLIEEISNDLLGSGSVGELEKRGGE